MIDRQTGRKIFESMPLCELKKTQYRRQANEVDVRVGMHLLFVSGSSYMSYPSVEKLLTAQSVKRESIFESSAKDQRAKCTTSKVPMSKHTLRASFRRTIFRWMSYSSPISANTP